MRIAISSVAALAAVLSAASAFQPSVLRVPITTVRSSSSAPILHYPPSTVKKSKLAAPLRMADDEAAESTPSTSGTGTATMPNEIFNLVKSIVGAGVLSLPAGIAAFGNAPSAVIPAVALICIIGGFSAYGFSLIGRVCSYTGGQSYRGAWSESVGDETSWIPAVTCTFKTCFAVLSYSMILGDTIRALLMTFGIQTTRTLALLGVTGTTLLPLCLLKNLSSLAPFSLAGIAGMFYTTVAMALRYLGGSYKMGTAGTKAAAAVPAGKYIADVATNYQPQFGNLGASAALSPNTFILICMLSTAYMAHFNAPKFFIELKDNTIKRYNTVVGTSFGISIFLFALIGALGFLTFGSASSGLILNNYAATDGLMSLSRFAVTFSIIFSFPLVFVGARDGWLDLLKVPMEKRTDSVLTKTTLAILSGITLIATQLKELAFIMSFAGATLGNALIYVYPAVMFRAAVKKMGDKASKGLKREVPFAMFSALLGVGMGAIGTKMAFGLL
mmetsp:Transcript_14403/g.20423  ORF Transcript_14403/g.20423 Transcript_14403/m.20423 type:complete len:501 (+) Transcript_14403:59-1561(+)